MQHPKWPDSPLLTEQEFKRMLTEYWWAKELDSSISLGRWFNKKYNLVNPTLAYKLDDEQARTYIEEHYGARNYYTDCWTRK